MSSGTSMNKSKSHSIKPSTRSENNNEESARIKKKREASKPTQTNRGNKPDKIDQDIRKPIAINFARVICILGIISFVALVLMKLFRPETDATIFANICLTILGYIAGILNNQLDKKKPK